MKEWYIIHNNAVYIYGWVEGHFFPMYPQPVCTSDETLLRSKHVTLLWCSLTPVVKSCENVFVKAQNGLIIIYIYIRFDRVVYYNNIFQKLWKKWCGLHSRLNVLDVYTNTNCVYNIIPRIIIFRFWMQVSK